MRRATDAAHPALRARASAALLVVVVAAAAAAACGRHRDGEHASSAHAVAGRLLAPCCWNQTLDIHESPVATTLRREIEQRTRAGEPAAAIEDDLAARYGERIRAVPRGRDPRTTVVVGALGVMALVAVVLLRRMRRWTRRASAPAIPPAAPPRAPQADGYDAQIDAALRALDED